MLSKGQWYRKRWRLSVSLVFVELVLVIPILLVACSAQKVKEPANTPAVAKKTWKESLAEAERCLVCRDYASAEAYYKETLTKIDLSDAKKTVDQATLVEIQALLALSLAKQDKIDESQPYTERVVKYVETVKLKPEQSEILTVIDQLCDEYVRIAKEGHTAKDRMYLEKALTLQHLCHVGNSARGVNLMTDLAISNIHAKNMPEARKFIAISMKYAAATPNRDFTNHTIQLLKVYAVLDSVNEKNDAKKVFQFVDELYAERFGSLRKAHFYDRMGSAYYEFGDYDKSIENFKIGLEEAKKVGFTVYDIARSYEKLALAYEQKGDQTTADSSFQSAIAVVLKPQMTEEEKRLAFEIVSSYVPYLKRRNRMADAAAWKAKGDELIQHMLE